MRMPLVESFDKTLGSTNFDHTANNAMVLLDQSCSLPQLNCPMTDQLNNICLKYAPRALLTKQLVMLPTYARNRRTKGLLSSVLIRKNT